MWSALARKRFPEPPVFLFQKRSGLNSWAGSPSKSAVWLEPTFSVVDSTVLERPKKVGITEYAMIFCQTHPTCRALALCQSFADC